MYFFHVLSCPEKNQKFGREAEKFVADMINGKQVTITEFFKDYYDRTIGSISLNNQDVGIELVRAGLAWHDHRNSENDDLANLEKEARQNKIGLWVNDPIPPWEYLPSNMEVSYSP